MPLRGRAGQGRPTPTMASARAGKPHRILIVEDHFLAGLALTTLIEDQPDLQLVARAETGWQAVSLFEQHLPDLVIMDFRLPEMDGASATAAIKRGHPKARILVLSASEKTDEVRRALEAGAAGYMKKDADGPALLAAIRAVAQGQPYVPEELARRLEEVDAETRLTYREGEILSLVAQGLSNQDVAERLQISEGTVRVHMSHLMLKLGVKRRTEAVALALKRGLVNVE